MKKYLDSPIFSLVCLPEGILLSCGGGGKRFGLQNYLALYPKPVMGQLKDPIYQLDLGDEIYENLKTNYKAPLVYGNSEDHCVVIYVADNQIHKAAKFKSDFAIKEPYQNDVVLKDQYLVTGGEDGVIKFWNVQSNPMDFIQNGQLDVQAKIHSLDFHPSQQLLIAACDDYECKIINYKDQRIVKKLSIATKNTLDLKFHTAIFSQDDTTIFTFKNPLRGASYMTVWQMNRDTITATKTIKLHNHPIICVRQSREGMYLGAGFADGYTKIFNTRYHDVEAEQLSHEMVVKGVSFSPESRMLLSGSVDFTYSFLPNVRPEGWFSKFSKFWLGIMFIAYIFTFILDLFN